MKFHLIIPSLTINTGRFALETVLCMKLYKTENPYEAQFNFRFQWLIL
jgi:hypothetical protein